MAEQDDGASAPDIQPAAELLPVVYAELRRLAAALTGSLPPGQTLQPTALVHEAYLRLVGEPDPGWEGRRHFFGAAAQAMREILIEQARRKASRKRGGGARRVELAEGLALIEPPGRRPAGAGRGDPASSRPRSRTWPRSSMLRYYTGLSVEETADVLGRVGQHASRASGGSPRAWLAGRLGDDGRPTAGTAR